MTSQNIQSRIINRQNPNSSLPSLGSRVAAQRPYEEIVLQNQQLKKALAEIQRKKRQQPAMIQQTIQPSVSNDQFNRRYEQKNAIIAQLKNTITSQQRSLQTYKQRLKDFEQNLQKIMKLDKDIHGRLVNPQSSSTLDKNVRSVLIALNQKAPYDKLIKMIDTIHV